MSDPTTHTELDAARRAAGAAYIAAADNLLAIYLELSALDLTISNTNATPDAQQFRSFAQPLEIAPHAEFLPGTARRPDHDAVMARHHELLRSMGV